MKHRNALRQIKPRAASIFAFQAAADAARRPGKGMNVIAIRKAPVPSAKGRDPGIASRDLIDQLAGSREPA
jgi:hypothetical protein